MNTITTKQLRENMSKVISDLEIGKSVHLSYRHRIIGILQPVNYAIKPLRRGSSESILNTLNSINLGPTASKLHNSNKSLKEEIRELRERDLV
jgi:antitoxin (DNA-binding transcriptional repressor) of toxin-antitoxin stability system